MQNQKTIALSEVEAETTWAIPTQMTIVGLPSAQSKYGINSWFHPSPYLTRPIR
jgi:hypothetical protein